MKTPLGRRRQLDRSNELYKHATTKPRGPFRRPRRTHHRTTRGRVRSTCRRRRSARWRRAASPTPRGGRSRRRHPRFKRRRRDRGEDAREEEAPKKPKVELPDVIPQSDAPRAEPPGSTPPGASVSEGHLLERRRSQSFARQELAHAQAHRRRREPRRHLRPGAQAAGRARGRRGEKAGGDTARYRSQVRGVHGEEGIQRRRHPREGAAGNRILATRAAQAEPAKPAARQGTLLGFVKKAPASLTAADGAAKQRRQPHPSPPTPVTRRAASAS